jgi:hypothetical protein
MFLISFIDLYNGKNGLKEAYIIELFIKQNLLTSGCFSVVMDNELNHFILMDTSYLLGM